MVLVNPNHLLHMLSRFVALQSQHLLHAYRLRCAWRTRRGMLIALWRRPWFWAQPTRLWQQAEVCALLVACSARLTRWSRFCLLVSRIDKEFVCSSYALIKSLSARLTHWSRSCLPVSCIDQGICCDDPWSHFVTSFLSIPRFEILWHSLSLACSVCSVELMSPLTWHILT